MTKNGNEFAHREFVTDIFSGPTLSAGATLFNLQQYVINPADVVLFPWIQQIAENYEMYELLGLIFEYIPASGNAVSSTNAALGTVIFATQYNSLDAPFVSKRQMESYEFATSTVPSMSMIHPVECADQANALTTLYVNNPGAQTQAGDPRFANIGILNVATVGQQAANVNLGELWVSAHVRFKRPRLAPGAYTLHLTSSLAAARPSAADIFANAYDVDAVNSTITGVTFSSSGITGTFSWPIGYRGTYIMKVNTESQTGVTWSGPFASNNLVATTTGGITPYNYFVSTANTAYLQQDLTFSAAAANAVTIGFTFTFRSNGQAGTMSFVWNSLTGAPAQVISDVIFTQIGQGIDV
jgi:hypothetical protein